MRWARSCVQKRHGWAAQVPRRLASESSRRKAGISPRSEQLCWHSAWARRCRSLRSVCCRATPCCARRTRLMTGGAQAKGAFAIGLVTIGALVLTGLDKRLETLLVDQSPQWLTDLTTRF